MKKSDKGSKGWVLVSPLHATRPQLLKLPELSMSAMDERTSYSLWSSGSLLVQTRAHFCVSLVKATENLVAYYMNFITTIAESHKYFYSS